MVVFINGSINSGKSTLALLLAEEMNRRYPSVHIEGDLVVDKSSLCFFDWVDASVKRIAELGCEAAVERKWAFVSYPLREKDWQVILNISDKYGVSPLCITLAPSLEVASGNRSGRILTDWEKKRVHEMYREGYQNRAFSSLIIDNSTESPQDACIKIMRYLESCRLRRLPISTAE